MHEIPRAYRRAGAWYLLAILLSGIIGAEDFGATGGRRGAAAAGIQRFLQWLLVEPMGLAGGVAVLFLLATIGAVATWPRLR